jgi:hypothetical protein
MIILGALLKASYLLHRHLWAGLSLDRWLGLLLLMAAGLMATGLIPGGVAGVVLCAVLLAFFLILQLWARRRNYLVFRPAASSLPRNPHPIQLNPHDKLPVRATGQFEVEGKEQTFTELQAYFRSFQTREHAVMAIVPPSRLLLIGQWPAADIGMWYIFFKSEELRDIAIGDTCFGRRLRPALRLAVEQKLPPKSSPLEAWGVVRSDKPKPKLRQQVIYMSFDRVEDRDRVRANLLVDASGLVVP